MGGRIVILVLVVWKPPSLCVAKTKGILRGLTGPSEKLALLDSRKPAALRTSKHPSKKNLISAKCQICASPPTGLL